MEPGNKPETEKSNGKGLYGILVLVSVAFIFTVGFIVANRWGLGTTSDSAQYLSAAEKLAEGKGLVTFQGEKLTHFPPLYPVILALPALLGASVLTAAKYLNALLYGLSIFLVGFVTYDYTDNSTLAGLFAALLFGGFAGTVYYYSIALSEPLFISLLILGLFFLAKYLESHRRCLLIASSVAASLAFLTKYSGLAIILTGLLLLAVSNGRKGLRKLVDTVVFGAVGFIPAGIWMLRNTVVSSTATDRVLAFHPMSLAQLKTVYTTALSWAFPFFEYRLVTTPGDPGIFQGLIVLAAIAGVSVFIFLTVRKGRADSEKGEVDDGKPMLVRVFGTFCLIYVAVVLVTVTFFDAYLLLGFRHWLPVFASLVVLGAYGAYVFYRKWGEDTWNRPIKITVAVLLLLFTVAYLASGIIMFKDIHRDSLGYSSPRWQNSQLIEGVDSLSPDAKIISNGPPAIFLLAGRDCTGIPSRTLRDRNQDNPDFDSQMREFVSEMENEGAVLVYMDALERPKKLNLKEIRKYIRQAAPTSSLKAIERYRHAIILKLVSKEQPIR